MQSPTHQIYNLVALVNPKMCRYYILRPCISHSYWNETREEINIKVSLPVIDPCPCDGELHENTHPHNGLMMLECSECRKEREDREVNHWRQKAMGYD